VSTAVADFREQYGDTLVRYLQEAREAPLQQGYELARKAMAQGLGVLDIAQMHREALLRVVGVDAGARKQLADAGSFLIECLSPFEMSHRGAQEGSRALQAVNDLLEKELQRVAHALHDEAGQLLAAVHLAITQFAVDLPADKHWRIAQTQKVLHDIESELRAIAYDLHPPILDNLGLWPAIEALADRVQRRSGIPITLSKRDPGRFDAQIETVLYRIVQEGLNNAVKHARAKTVGVEIRREADRVLCQVHDDGIGIGPEATERPAGLGMRGMHARVQALGGVLHLQSAPQQGTTLQAEIPLREAKHDLSDFARG
jgi:signal transduction histidine kinase